MDKVNEVCNVIIVVAVVFGILFGICGAIYEEVTRDPAKTALYERVDRERKEAEDRAIVNRVLFEQNKEIAVRKAGSEMAPFLRAKIVPKNNLDNIVVSAKVIG